MHTYTAYGNRPRNHHQVTGGYDEIELGTSKVMSRAYVSWFGFKGGDQQKKVSNLSGGERNRVQLAKLLRSGGNVLLMDEPTNACILTPYGN